MLADWNEERRIRRLVKQLRVEMDADPEVAAHVEALLHNQLPWPTPVRPARGEAWLRSVFFPVMLLALTHVFVASDPWSFLEAHASHQRTCDIGLCSTPVSGYAGDLLDALR